MRRIFVFILLLFLSGCTYYAPPGEHHTSRVVTAIEVTASIDGQQQQRHYTSTDKMQTVLNYLRVLRPQLSTAISPDTFRTDAYRITLILSDGTKQVYHQIYDTYLQKDGGVWHSIDAAAGSALLHMLEKMPSDPL